MTTITATQILNTVVELGRANPEGRAAGRYVNPDNTPCCIVGHALIKHGIKPEVFAGRAKKIYEDTDPYQPLNTMSVGFGLLTEVGVVEGEEEESSVLHLVTIQSVQDSGRSWGQALAVAGL